MNELIFIKLGGSLITDKSRPGTPRFDVINRLSQEIAELRTSLPELHILLGHGSGSFGHVAAAMYKTRDGVNSPKDWLGFVEVWYEAKKLNHIVMDALHQSEVPAIAFPPCAQVTTSQGNVEHWNINVLRSAMDHGITPVIYGDVIFDSTLGGTILSTEELFSHLAVDLRPNKILLAGVERGVWKDYPRCSELVSVIKSDNWDRGETSLGNSANTDVTGGMRSKVNTMLNTIALSGCEEVVIFSGLEPGNLNKAVQGDTNGTRITI